MHDPYRGTLASLPAMRRHSEQKPYPLPDLDSTRPRREALKNTAGKGQPLQAQGGEQRAQSDLASMRRGDSFTSDRNGLTSDVTRTGTDTATEKSDAALGTAAAGTACLNVATVDLDATTVGDDASIVSDDVSTLTGDIATAAQDIAALKNDMAALSASGLPAPPAAAAAVSAAGQALKRAAAQANGEIDHLNTDLARAYAIPPRPPPPASPA